MKPLQLENQRFGRLVVIKKHFENDKNGNSRWECVCDCGNFSITNGNSLTSGKSKSCGCLRNEAVSASMTTHSHSATPTYRSWSAIKRRCLVEKDTAYPKYGGRGITMCDEWKESFEAFYRDMGPRPSLGHSVERRDNNKGYFPNNCYWATRTEQANNRSSNTHYEMDGVIKTLAEWCRYFGVRYDTVCMRISRGMLFEEAIKIPKLKTSTAYTINGVTKSIGEWCAEFSVKFVTVMMRVCRGWKFVEALRPIEKTIILFEGEEKTLYEWCKLFELDCEKTYLRIIRGEDFSIIARE